MQRPVTSLNGLAGTRIVLIGRFARISRKELARRLTEAGAIVEREVTPTVSHVVVGSVGWPLRKDGRLPRGLLMARILQARQATPVVVEESRFRQQFASLFDEGESAPSAHPSNEAAPANVSYRDASRARILVEMLQAGVSPRQLQRALWQLSRWCPEARDAWEQLAPVWDGRQLVLRLPNGDLVEPQGQRVFDYSTADKDAAITLPLMAADTADDLFGQAVTQEQVGDFEAAEASYRRLLLIEGFDADVCFNLANVLVAQNQRRAALERLWQCAELAPRFAEAWHNLGVVACELELWDVARRAFQEAVAIAPEFRAANAGLDFLQRSEPGGEPSPLAVRFDP